VDDDESQAQQPMDGHDTPIEVLGLSVRAYNCLKRSGLTTVGLVLEKSEEELLALRNFGEKSYEELRSKLVDSGFPSPRVDTRRAAPAVAAPTAAPAQPADAAAGDAREGDSVGALGQALIEALKEAGEDPSDLAEDR
jgi:DNA-directed RNA polymerase subunit alpha